MRGILSQVCLRTSASLGVGRFRSNSLFQNYRNLSVACADLFRQSIVNNSKNDEGDENQNSVKTKNENPSENVVKSSNDKSSTTWSQFARHKYERFSESSTRIIYDFDEEQKRIDEGLDIEEQEKRREEVPLKRGLTGVFDVEELVDLLREENVKDIAVVKVPGEMKYVDYMVFATSKSRRHINATSQLVRRVYKKKKNHSDRFSVVEGKDTDWVALDLGNIALHVMSPELRESYDLESLWTVGAQYDEKCQEENEQDPMNLYNFIPASQNAFVSQVSDETRVDTSASQLGNDT